MKNIDVGKERNPEFRADLGIGGFHENSLMRKTAATCRPCPHERAKNLNTGGDHRLGVRNSALPSTRVSEFPVKNDIDIPLLREGKSHWRLCNRANFHFSYHKPVAVEQLRVSGSQYVSPG